MAGGIDWEAVKRAAASGGSSSGSTSVGNGTNTYNPPVPAYEAYNRMPVRPAVQYQPGGYSGIPSSYTGATANSLGTMQSAFMNSPSTQATVMAAASAYYGYPVKNMSYGMSLINDAVQMAGSNPSGPTAWSMITGLLNGSSPMGAGGAPGGGGGGGGGGGSSTTIQYRLTDPDSAKQLVNAAMSNLLGRRATDDEFKEFLTSLNKEEKANPIVTTSSGDTVSTTGGTSPTQITEDYVTSREDYAEYTAATSLMDAFMAALDDPVSI